MPRLFLVSAFALLASACSSTQFAGIAFAPGAADPALQQLARRAEDGDKQAALELGIRFEEGQGVPRDLARAERLYRIAASNEPSYTYLYQPPVTKNGVGSVLPIQTGYRRVGLAEARMRLRALEQVRSGR